MGLCGLLRVVGRGYIATSGGLRLSVAYDATTIVFLVCAEVAFPRTLTHDTGGQWCQSRGKYDFGIIINLDIKNRIKQ